MNYSDLYSPIVHLRGLVSVEDGHRGNLPVIGQLPKVKAIGDIFDLVRAGNRNSSGELSHTPLVCTGLY